MKRTITEGLGEFTPKVWSEIREVVEEPKQDDSKATPSREKRRLLAKISSNTAVQLANRAQWKYEFSEVSCTGDPFTSTGFAVKAGGVTSTAVGLAVNLLEVANVTALAYGVVMHTDGISVADDDQRCFKFGQIPKGTIVMIELRRRANGTLMPCFEATNPIIGVCKCPTGLCPTVAVPC